LRARRLAQFLNTVLERLAVQLGGDALFRRPAFKAMSAMVSEVGLLLGVDARRALGRRLNPAHLQGLPAPVLAVS
jgi:hypothetical protein